jgi:ketosteroid isomerase-like protein
VSAAVAELARRFFDAIEAGDIDAVGACYADDAVIWHNTDGLEQAKAENLEVLANFVQALPVRRYEDRRLIATDDGFVQQHRLVCPRADGSQRELACAIVCRVADGRITRLDEYFDSAQLAAWRRSQPFR